MAFDGEAERNKVLVLVSVDIGGREAVRDGSEAEIRNSGEGGVAAAAKDATVVEVGVDEGDVEAHEAEGFGEVEHGVDVALGREGDADCMGLGFCHGGREVPPQTMQIGLLIFTTN